MPAFDPAPKTTRTTTAVASNGVTRLCPDRVEGVSAGRSGKQAEGEQKSKRPGARHDDVDETGARVVGLAVMGHDQRPRGKRHQFPAEQEGEGVVGEHDEVHCGEKCRKERQHAFRRVFVAPVAETEIARTGAAEIDDQKKERRERVQAEVRADPRNAERQRHGVVVDDCRGQASQGDGEKGKRNEKARPNRQCRVAALRRAVATARSDVAINTRMATRAGPVDMTAVSGRPSVERRARPPRSPRPRR